MTNIEILEYLINRLRKLPSELAGIAGENVKPHLHTFITQATAQLSGVAGLTPSKEDVDIRPVYWLLKAGHWLMTNQVTVLPCFATLTFGATVDGSDIVWSWIGDYVKVGSASLPAGAAKVEVEVGLMTGQDTVEWTDQRFYVVIDAAPATHGNVYPGVITNSILFRARFVDSSNLPLTAWTLSSVETIVAP
jgi:hypothetical protein